MEKRKEKIVSRCTMFSDADLIFFFFFFVIIQSNILTVMESKSLVLEVIKRLQN
jgi:hypothetical protein